LLCQQGEIFKADGEVASARPPGAANHRYALAARFVLPSPAGESGTSHASADSLIAAKQRVEDLVAQERQLRAQVHTSCMWTCRKKSPCMLLTRVATRSCTPAECEASGAGERQRAPGAHEAAGGARSARRSGAARARRSGTPAAAQHKRRRLQPE